MFVYKVISVNESSAEEKLNELAWMGWKVVGFASDTGNNGMLVAVLEKN